MKSRSLKTGLFIHTFVLILLIFNKVLVHAEGDDDKITIDRNGWIETSAQNWPPKDGNSNEPFYFYHSNYDPKLFGINSEFLEGKTPADGTKFDFAFRYWINDITGLFRAVKRNDKEAKFETNSGWADSHKNLTGLTKEQLLSLRLVNTNSFTAAFKDLKVKYLESITFEDIEEFPFKDYKTTTQSIKLGDAKPDGATKSNRTVKVLKPPTPENKEQSTVVPFFNLIESSQPTTDKDFCYQLSPPLENNPIEVYFTFESMNNGIKLLTIDKSNSAKALCINDYIALWNMKNFRLTFVIRGEIVQDADLTLTKTIKDKVNFTKKLRTPGDEIAKMDITTGWYYYNQFYSYSIKAPVGSQIEEKIWACDIVANCIPYVLSTDKTQYDIKPEYTHVLLNSPFIRIRIDNANVEKFKFVQTSDQSAIKLFTDQFKEANKHFKPTELASDNAETKITLVKSNDFATEKTTVVQIPFAKLDYRTHQIVIEINMSTTPSVPNKETFVRLTNLEYKNGIAQHPLSYWEKPIKFSHFQFGTQNLFATQPTDLVEAESKKARSLEMTFERINPNDIMEIRLTVLKASQVQLENYSLKDAKYKDNNIRFHFAFKPAQKISSTASRIELPKKQMGFIKTDWIRAGVSQKLINIELNVTLKISRKDGKNWENKIFPMHIFRVILPQDGHPFVTMPSNMSLTDSDKRVSIQDIIAQDDGERELNGPFRVGYIFMSYADFEILIDVDNFDVKSPQIGQQNCNIGPVVASLDCKYEQAFCEIGELCNARNSIYRYEEKVCNSEGCSNIFDPPLAMSNKYFNPSDHLLNIPYQNRNSKNTHMKVEPPKARKPGDDFCIQFDYKSNSKSLFVYAKKLETNEFDSKLDYAIEYPPTGVNKEQIVQEQKEQKICASYLSNDVAAVKAIYFHFEQTPIIDSDNYYVKIVQHVQPEVFKTLNSTEFDATLSSGDFFWPRSIDQQNHWKFGSRNVLNFTIQDLNKVKDVNGDTFVSFLRTKWYRVPNRDNFEQFLLGINPVGADLSKSNKDISFSIYSPEKLLVSKAYSEISNNKLNAFEFKSQSPVKYYQLTIKLTLYLKDLDLTKEEAKKFAFSLGSFTVNDPCLVSTDKFIGCNNRAVEKKSCTRNYETFSPKCNCVDGFVGDYCQMHDYCKKQIDGEKTKKTNDQLCESPDKCKSNYELQRFECECGKDQAWDSPTRSCIDNVVKCPANEYSVLDNGKFVKCECLDGYEREKSKDCERINPCKNKEAVCPDKNSVCQIEIDSVGHVCKCNKGYVNQLTTGPNAKCLHQKCEIDSACEQLCEPTKDSYECKCFSGYTKDTNGKCKLTDTKLENKCQSKLTPAPYLDSNGKCACVFGYKLNQTDCVLDTEKNSDFGRKYNCEKGVVMVDDKPACNCDKKTQILDVETRSCKSKTDCTKEEAEKCTKQRNAAACSADPKTGEPICKCDANQVKYASKESDASKWRCVSNCDLFSRGFKDQGCNGAFQDCVDDKVKVEQLLNETFFIGEISKIKSKSTDHCICGLGFELTGKKCGQRKDPQVDVEIDFNVEANIDLIKRYYRNFIELEVTRTIDRIECKKTNESKTVMCQASFPYDKPTSVVKALLKERCRPLANDSNKCAYQMKRLAKRSVANEGTFYDGPQAWVGVLVREINKEVKVETVNLCETSSPCKSFEYSQCQKANNNSHYIQCTCDGALFDVKSEEPIDPLKKDIKFQTCTKKDLCTLNPKDYGCSSDAKCNLRVDYDAGARKYVAQSFCTCASNLTLPNRNVSCAQTCTKTCGENANSCAQDIYDSTKYICNCKDGYKGEKCQDKTGANIFLYSTIGASVIALIALIGLGVFCIKRNSSRRVR